MTKEQAEKRLELLKLAEKAIKKGEFSESILEQAKLYMQLAELYKG